MEFSDSGRRLGWLGAAAWTAVSISLVLIFFVARTAQSAMGGELQRIFYFHVPAAWVAYLAFAIVFMSSIAYLRTNDRRWDILANSSAELGVVFLALVLITGPIWAHPVWGTWWQWDARLTSTLVTWLTYVGYLFIRNLTTDRRRGGRLAAVVGIIGLVNIPIVHFSVYWWRTLHPTGPTPANPTANSGLGTPELAAFFTSLAAFTLLFAWLLAMRARLGRLEDRADELEMGVVSGRRREAVVRARQVVTT
ncbi:MAG: heme exporter protein [Actinomycetota bacterium]|nr:heme exporter protein [Actinomycetota bacterium]